MIEPRSSLFYLHRKLSYSRPEETEEFFYSEAFDDLQPERPIHPALEYEVLLQEEDEEDGNINNNPSNSSHENKEDMTVSAATPETPTIHSTKTNKSRLVKLVLSFILLLISGTGTVVLMKLQAIPMYNYPNFINLFCHFCYIPLSFLYIIPMIRYGTRITPEHIAMSRTPFLIMGALDCLASSLQLFAAIYVPGNLLVLLPQAVIPCSMALSYMLRREHFHWRQYTGALIVLLGLVVVLEPLLTFHHATDYYCEAVNVDHDCTVCQSETTQQSCLSHVQPIDDVGEYANLCQWLPYQQASRKDDELTFGWSLLLLASAIPMTLSAMYKQAALDIAELDPVYLNGWISIFQFFFALLVAVPAAWMTNVAPFDVPQNMWDGLTCFLGHDTNDSGCHPDACSSHTPILVGAYLAFAMLYSTCMLCVLKYGSTSILFLAQTILVPVGNLAFSFPLFQNNSSLYTSYVMGLVVILLGLILYRFWGDDEPLRDDPSQGTSPWVQQYLQVQGEAPSPWYLDMMEHLRTQVQQTGNTPWLNELLRHMEEPLLQGRNIEYH
ncbi:hypothetical protein FisN_14Lh347 [Fistulifera solaris]|uniref:EamA domain-containing protein n=1 Tax=Fistulifera solaris TaxID=1519565 RepID=A0A1Z5JIG9_FISSO|nr:hypothetical protein FisN_14Lh347 [Fistulifera solaris]|eukprot:GAX13642.1 hypothetical protein FisN_14Lh347 [Fistulifera solaris]